MTIQEPVVNEKDDVRPNARIHELTFDIPTVLVAGQSD